MHTERTGHLRGLGDASGASRIPRLELRAVVRVVGIQRPTGTDQVSALNLESLIDGSTLVEEDRLAGHHIRADLIVEIDVVHVGIDGVAIRLVHDAKLVVGSGLRIRRIGRRGNLQGGSQDRYLHALGVLGVQSIILVQQVIHRQERQSGGIGLGEISRHAGTLVLDGVHTAREMHVLHPGCHRRVLGRCPLEFGERLILVPARLLVELGSRARESWV